MESKTITTEVSMSLVWDFIIGLTAFAIPFFVSGPQWLTGTTVNTLLFIAVIRLPRKRLLPVIILPSIGALLHGVLFGPLTLFLIYFLPFIWIGNLILISVFAYLKKRVAGLMGIIIAASFKSLFLFAIANGYFHFHLVPKLFINSMGFIQLVTAISGGLLAIFILKAIGNQHE